MNKFLSRIFLIISILILTACSSNKNDTKNSIENSTKNNTIEINHNRGKSIIESNTKSILVLDSRSYETLESWNIDLKAVPKNSMPKDSKYVLDKNVDNLGNHKEPNFEKIATINPKVVIVGQRFSQHYDTLKEILPDSEIIDININLDKSENPGKDLIEGFKNNTLILGKIFNKQNEAQKIIDEFDNAVNLAKSHNTNKTFMGLIVSGGEIGYSAPKTGRVWGAVFEILNLKPALEISKSSTNHKGDDISVESIAKSNPDAILVLDRDSSIASENSSPAKDSIEGSKTLSTTNAIKNNNIFYAPNDLYTNESIQGYTELFNTLSEFLSKL